MKHILFYTILSLFFSLTACKEQPSPLTTNTIRVAAPFDMPEITVPNFSQCPQLSIVDYGAVKGDKEKTSEALKKAIHQANKIGGATVVIPEGEWLTKALHFKSNVNLHLNKGAVLLFSENPEDYLPAVHTSLGRDGMLQLFAFGVCLQLQKYSH